jgi:hypothetical protein
MLPGDAGITEDFLARLVGRALGMLPVIRPAPLPVWASPMLPPEAAWEMADPTSQTPPSRPATVPAEGARARGGPSVARQTDEQLSSPGGLPAPPAPPLHPHQGQEPALPLHPLRHQEGMQETSRDAVPGQFAVARGGQRRKRLGNWPVHAFPGADDPSPVAEAGKPESHAGASGLPITTPASMPDLVPQAAPARMTLLASNAPLTDSPPRPADSLPRPEVRPLLARPSDSTASSAGSGHLQRQTEPEGWQLAPAREQGRPGVVPEPYVTVPDFSLMRPAYPPAPMSAALFAAAPRRLPGADLADLPQPGELPPLPRPSHPMNDSERPGQFQHQVGAEPAEPREAPSHPTAAAAPTIRVTIGRIEVQAVLPTPRSAPAPRPVRPQPALSLEAYLQQRAEQRR